MNTFKRNALTSAVFASLGIAGTAHAVYQDANGLGQALIYPYYTVQNSTGGNAFNTYISVVNTTTSGKVVKVRFREGKNSREVLDFNLYLSPNDVWTGSVVPDGTGDTVGGRLLTFDNSCTNPGIPVVGVAFRNYAYSGTANDDGAGTGLDRTREGYIEMVEMATLTGASLAAITHASSGAGIDKPANCAAVQGPVVTLALAAPTGGLSGTGTLINVNSGADAGYEAIALANVTVGTIYTDIGNELGNLAQADPVSVVVTSGSATRIYRSIWLTGIDAVSSTMMHSSVINEYVMDSATKSNTDWVMTFPTKRFYVTTAAAAAPFTNKFTATGSCETIGFTYFNREERGQQAGGGDFSPLPPGQTASSLCWESTVLSIRANLPQNPTGTSSGVLGSVNTTVVNLTDPFQAGWGRMTFTNPAAAVTGIVSQATSSTQNVTTGAAAVAGAQTYNGLPVVGFMVRTFNNGNLSCAGATCQGNYGSAFNHSFLDTVAPAP